MFEIIDDEKKQIIISLHLEEIYTKMRLKSYIKDQAKLFREENLSKSCIDYLVGMKFNDEKYQNYEYIIDCSHIKYIAQNSKKNFFQWLLDLSSIRISHCEECNFRKEIIEIGIDEEKERDYITAFNDYGKKYILENCLDPEGYITQIGIQIGVYIDLKKIINDSIEMLRWCYVIASNLDDYFSSVNENEDKKNLFFCHTMNGAYIAGMLSLLLGYDLVYVDHLGPYNKLNKVDFYKEKSRSEEFIIIADMVCQGNEFLRAKNIVEYLGGTVRGCAGILKMNISNLLSSYGINVFAIEYSPECAKKELNYTIRTELCSENCEGCK